MNEFLASLGISTLRVTTPLLFAAMAGLLCERSGVVNIALEGTLLVGSFFAAAAAQHFHSPWMGALGGGLSGMIFAALLSLFVLRFRAQQIVAGIALNILAVGLTPFFCKIFYGATGSSPSLPLESRFVMAPLWMSWLLVAIVALWMRRSVSGLWLQFAGEKPEALQAAGLSVGRIRFCALLAGGFLAGLGGASLSVFLSSSFSRNMSSGRGFIALAALVLGKWRPWGVAVACLFFALADALQIQLQGAEFLSGGTIPVQFIQVLPYLVTLLVLGGIIGASRPPASLGKPFDVF